MAGTLELDIDDCAVLCMEMQRGIVGDLGVIPGLMQAVRDTDLIAQVARFFGAVRKADVPIIQMTAGFRSDWKGSYANMPQVNALRKGPAYLVVGSPETEVVPDIRDPSDLVIPRLHGVTPLTDTGVDSMLRSLGKRTIIATGVSVNLGILGIAIEGVNRGYRVVVPKDAVTGYPLEYRDMVFEHSLQKIATLTTIDEIIALFEARSAR